MINANDYNTIEELKAAMKKECQNKISNDMKVSINNCKSLIDKLHGIGIILDDALVDLSEQDINSTNIDHIYWTADNIIALARHLLEDAQELQISYKFF